MALKNITLELSFKPFRDESEELMRSVAEKMFSQWKTLADASDAVSVMLWTADGSEILDYSGNLDDKFEWAYWCGVANACPPPDNYPPMLKKNTHFFPQKYIPDAAPRPYSYLKRLIGILRETGKRITGKEIRIGATFDNGPEFALSDFKYKRHKEIMLANTMYKGSNVVCIARLHADKRHYAAFPGGIPEGTSLGTFLGKQFQSFAKDLGFDYLWLSNGMGFGLETWGITGSLFDKKMWHPEKADAAAEAMLTFWHDLVQAYPGIRIETRGSNYSAGTEIATDAAPLKELYRDHVIAAPVNSPWAAINYLSGLEIAAWMSHIAELPDARIPFRFYAHDPWFMNSPWLDRYGREPWDIYQPLSVSRINEQGECETANTINILSVDSTFGAMPDQVPREVIPHLLKAACDENPDRPGPFLWIYPFDEYNELVRGKKRRPDVVFAEEQYIGQTIQSGFPLNTVISTGNFRKLGPERFKDLIKVVPVSAWESVRDHLSGDVLFYGTLAEAPGELLSLIGAENLPPVTGKAELETDLEEDVFSRGTLPRETYLHDIYLGGGITEKAKAGTKVLAAVRQGSEVRDVLLMRTLADGRKIGFARMLLPLDPEIRRDSALNLKNAFEVYPVDSLLRKMLPCFGWTFRGKAHDAGTEMPRINLSRHDNAFFYSVFSRDTTTGLETASPLGAPVASEMETLVSGGLAHWTPAKFSRYSCRCFVKQKEESVISCKIGTAEIPSCRGRRYYHNFKDAQIRFFPPAEAEGRLEVYVKERPFEWWSMFELEPAAFEWETTPFGKCAVLKHVTGSAAFIW